jgi:hypothetical protein
MKSIWQSEAETRANVEWAYDFGEALRPHFTGAYANYIDPLLTDWQRRPHQFHKTAHRQPAACWRPSRMRSSPNSNSSP